MNNNNSKKHLSLSYSFVMNIFEIKEGYLHKHSTAEIKYVFIIIPGLILFVPISPSNK